VELLRISKNAWGQEVLIGISWDLIPLFFWAAVVFIVGHILYKWFLAPDRGQRNGTK
jgi:hypothetical protein